MRTNRRVFLSVEAALAVLAAVLVLLMFGRQEETRQVTVIVSNSDAGQWQAFVQGVKQASRDEGLNLVITSTGRIVNASAEKILIRQAAAEGTDALILQPAPGGSVTAGMLKETVGKLPTILAERDAVWDTADGAGSGFPCVSADPYACGMTLAQEILTDYGGKIEGKRIGIVNRSLTAADAVQREEGFLAGIRNTGAVIAWQIHGLELAHSPEQQIAEKAKVDLIVALNTDCLEAAGTAGKDGRVHGAVIYGIGTSIQTISDLDHDYTRGLLYINGFNTGYQCVQEIAEKLEHPGYRMKSHSIDWRMLRQNDLFSQENEDVLFMVE